MENLDSLYNTEIVEWKIQSYAQFEFFRKGTGNSFSTTFCV